MKAIQFNCDRRLIDPYEVKACNRCGEEKALRDFDKDLRSKDAHKNTCTLCRREYQRQFRESREIAVSKTCSSCKAEKLRDNFHRNGNAKDGLTSRCKDCVRMYQLEYRKKRPHIAHENRLARYQLTSLEFTRMVESQDGRCAICKTEEPGDKNKSRLCIDHDHSTGRVRGLLCNQCNFALGGFKDRPDLLETAANYLRTHAV